MVANYIIGDILQQNALYLDAFQELFVVQIQFALNVIINVKHALIKII